MYGAAMVTSSKTRVGQGFHFGEKAFDYDQGEQRQGILCLVTGLLYIERAIAWGVRAKSELVQEGNGHGNNHYMYDRGKWTRFEGVRSWSGQQTGVSRGCQVELGMPVGSWMWFVQEKEVENPSQGVEVGEETESAQ